MKPKGNWFLVTVLGLVTTITATIGWTIWPAKPSLQRFEYSDPRNADYHPGGSKCNPTTLARISNKEIRLHQTESCQEMAEEYRQASDDLIQQTRAANAAQAQTEIASQQLLIAWLQALGGFLTLAAAVGAAIYARDAAKHTREANDIARESQRAWIALSALPKLIRRDGEDGLYVRIDTSSENKGNSPATHFEMETDLYFIGSGQNGSQVHDWINEKIATWKSEYTAGPLSTLMPGDYEKDSIWNSYTAEEIKWKELLPGTIVTDIIVLSAVFYRTVNKPDVVQLAWRSWFLHTYDESGNVVSWIPKPKATEIGPDGLCVEPHSMNLKLEQYPALDGGD